MRVLFDTNVVLDLLLAREPHASVAAQLISRVESGELPGLLGATTITTIHYLIGKAAGREAASRHIGTLLDLFEVAPVTRTQLRAALDAGFGDYEDAVLHAAAVDAGATAIVTRNARDFGRATLPVYAPTDLAKLLSL
ncbi:MAG: PIN domain-containing protein [Myxococcales bacterium]|nr:PIN domain-containing protein [Myxococcales bacterium]MCB9537451.1 PIN domain-containing protein [Myxococcales bacterium]